MSEELIKMEVPVLMETLERMAGEEPAEEPDPALLPLNLPGPVLVTGAGGQLGRELVRVFREAGADVRAMTREDLDITDMLAVEDAIEEIKPALILNAAAWTDVDAAEAEREDCRRVNTLAPVYMAGLHVPMVTFSTDYVFDGVGRTKRYNERNRVNPLNVYGNAKLDADELILGLGFEHGAQGIILRTSWLWSEQPGTKNFFQSVMRRIEAKKELRIVGDRVGSPTRALDLAKAVLVLVKKGAHLKPYKIYHAANLGSCSWAGFTKEIVRLLNGHPEEVYPISTQQWQMNPENFGKRFAQRPLLSTLNCNLLEREWGVVLPNWEESLKEGLDAYLQMKKDGVVFDDPDGSAEPADGAK